MKCGFWVLGWDERLIGPGEVADRTGKGGEVISARATEGVSQMGALRMREVERERCKEGGNCNCGYST